MEITIKNLKQIIQSANVNFLYGSGLSRNYLETLGNIEKLLTEAGKHLELSKKQRDIIKTSLYAEYFNGVMRRCLPSIIDEDKEKFNKTFNEYVCFLNTLNVIMSRRSVNLINKQINLFTTNIDDFTEKALEFTKVEFNDGFKGRINPIFSEDSFSNVIFKSSVLYQNNSTIPVFNLLKIHGSINWKSNDGKDVTYDPNLSMISKVSEELDKIDKPYLIEIKEDSQFDSLVKKARKIKVPDGLYDNFLDDYSKLVMINPTKAKFSETVLDYHFYELMRMYSNSLEKSSSVLFVAGFSFADEHIANITMRAANANPTLQIIVFAYNDNAKQGIEGVLNKKGLSNNNVEIISPEDYKAAIKKSLAKKEGIVIKDLDNLEHFDFASLNKYVFKVLSSVVI